MKTTIALTNPTDDELSAAVAEYVDGWRYVGMAATTGCDPRMWAKGTPGASDYVMRGQDQFRYATSADAVLPLLEKWVAQNGFAVNIIMLCDGKGVDVFLPGALGSNAPTFPRAACIALLSAHGVRVLSDDGRPQP